MKTQNTITDSVGELLNVSNDASIVLQEKSAPLIQLLIQTMQEHEYSLDDTGKLIHQQAKKLLDLYLNECPDVSAFAGSDEITPVLVSYRFRGVSDGLSRLLLLTKQKDKANTLLTLTRNIAEAYESYADAAMQLSAIMDT